MNISHKIRLPASLPAGTVMDALTAAHPNAHRTTLRHFFSQGRVLLNDQPARSLKQPVLPTDRVTIADVRVCPTQLPAGLKIIHQDADVMVVDKPPGLLTATHAQETRPTVLALLHRHVSRANGKNKIYLVHRLDQHASGLLVFARGVKALHHLKAQFRDHTITREYHVLVHGSPNPAQGRLTGNLIEGPDRIVRPCPADRGRPAILDYRLISPATSTVPLSHLQCRLFTGRKHQIRVQFNAAGHPVVGDPVYGHKQYPPTPGVPPRLALHAGHLIFRHPRTGREMEFISPLPPDITRQLTTSRPAHPLRAAAVVANSQPSRGLPPAVNLPAQTAHHGPAHRTRRLGHPPSHK